MSIYFDGEKKEIYLSVGDLITEGEKIKIGFSGNEGYERLWVGQSLHSIYQENQIYKYENYEKEVSVKYQFNFFGWKVFLQGRIDGVKREGDKLIVEEIKTIHFARDLPSFYDSETFKIYKKQTEIYAYILSLIEKKEIKGFLILLDIGTLEEKVLECSLDFKRIENFISNKIKRILRNKEMARERELAQKHFAKDISFIFPNYRPYQKELIDEVGFALKEKANIMVSAPTGLGKTVSAITPAIKFCLEKNLKLFFLTSKTLQQDMAVEVIKKINTAGVFHSIQIRAKEKMCATSSLLCHEKFCQYAKDYGKKKEESSIINKILNSFLHIDPDIIFNLAKNEGLCPFELSLELLNYAKFVVCDYNYIFDPSVSFFDLRDETVLSNVVLIIDEAHNLIERGRGYWSPEISKSQILQAIDKLLTCPIEQAEVLRNGLYIISNYFDKLGEDFLGNKEWVIDLDKKIFRDSIGILDSQILEYFSYLRNQESLAEVDPFLEVYFQLGKFTRVLENISSKFKILLKKNEDDLRIKIFCLDPAPFLNKILSKVYSSIAMSATLTPHYFYKRMLGFPHNKTIEATFPSPFPKENRKIFIYPYLDTTYKKRVEEAPKLAKLLYEMGNCVSGNFLVLFPSYDYMNEVLSHYNFKGKKILNQEKNQNLKESKELMRQVKQRGRNFLFFAVSGGLFAEGVDYPEEIFKGAFIISPSLPMVSLEQELLKKYYDEAEENGFSFAYVIPGITRVVQSAGRIIRSEKDRGIVVLICKRFKEGLYSKYFPDFWYENKPEELITDNPVKEIKNFLGGKFEKKKAINYHRCNNIKRKKRSFIN